MRKVYPAIWESIDETTSRRRVFGGWLVWSSVEDGSECMCYIPDKKHEWKIVKLEGRGKK